jgi:hypothetical protein
MAEIPLEVEQRLAAMDEGEWAAFTARVRAPDTSESFREAASKYVDGDQLEAVCAVANIAAFLDDDGQIDQAKVEQKMRAVFGLPVTPQWANQGQNTPPPPQPGPGERGNAEARKRFHGDGPLAPTRGNRGYQEAQRRFKNGEQA